MAEIHCGFVDDPKLGVSGSKLLVLYGPTIQVDIGFDPDFRPDPTKTLDPPKPGVTGQHALIDSGASDSCIDSLLAAQLKLPIVDRQRVSGVHGSGEVNIHLAQIAIPALGNLTYGRFAGVHLQAGGQVHLRWRRLKCGPQGMRRTPRKGIR